ncbi:TRAP transporter large permease subunit [Corynebacterium ammoniagenes]|uniref:TRAP transporter, DctM-like membrane protein n=1 Tax=Corynebacterium ammoniagenes DSM 20306 TaxID=649754 RepID=A0ABN0ABV4_CORAM|nr:TRAP transporter large permease subunit [Corynebacterium ammoniagenes]APT82206.1 C4-dicarboxylate ABC transporter permease [Corynebacterium ammoniagenes DSM 20306]AQS73302.1 C4-dicarboxylate ABC transporter permease [Corynebacterium ammoniagenes]EFG80218.1 TRAP transporter, DctM-like membrane protein [Corynebacterium ammoniagenes DSM 20306]
MPIALIALVVFIAVIVVWNVVFKRNMAEAMLVGFLATLLFAGGNAPEYVVSGVSNAIENEVLFAAAAFVFMTYFVQQTGVMDKLIAILSSALGRLPGGPALVDTVASGAMGALAGGSNTGNAAASGSITGPWMVRTGWTPHRAATVIAGNAGLGAALPPSASMVIMIGFAGTFVTTSQVYLALLIAGMYQVIYRVFLTIWFVYRDGIKAETGAEHVPLKVTMKRGWPSTLIFFGAVIPIFMTVGPLANALKASPVGDAMDDISLIMWIPILIIFISGVVAWKDLPKSPKAWWKFMEGGISHFYTIGAILFFAILASEILAQLGLDRDVNMVLENLNLPQWLLVVLVGLLVVAVAGPLSSSATLSAVGQVSLFAMVGAGVEPILALIAILVFASTEGASPPASGSIFVACGITGAKPEKTFIPLVIYYVVPFFILGVLIAIGVIPVPTGG